MYELNDDQNRVISVLKNPSHYIINNEENGIKGLPYKEIMKASGLTREKTLLSLGYLEANELVYHECAVQRSIVDYHGRSNVEIAGQKIVRMFSLSDKGKAL